MFLLLQLAGFLLMYLLCELESDTLYKNDVRIFLCQVLESLALCKLLLA